MGREDRIRELREELARLEAEERALQPWGVRESTGGNEYWFPYGTLTLQLPEGIELVVDQGKSPAEQQARRRLVENLALFPLMVEALRRHAGEDRDAAYLLHQIEGKP